MAARTLSLYTILLTIVLALGACKKDDFANETMGQLSKLADDIVTKVKDSEDKKAGVAEAQKLLDAAKTDLGPKMKEVGELRGFQVSEEAQANMMKVIADSQVKVSTLQIDLMSETMADKDLDAAVEKLADDFSKLIMGE